MKIKLIEMLNLKKGVSHLTFLVFSVLVSSFYMITGEYSQDHTFPFSVFIMLFIQLEVFVFFGAILFEKISFDRAPSDITRDIIFRFLIFLAGCMTVSLTLYLAGLYIGTIIRGNDPANIISVFIHKDILSWFKSTIKGFSLGAIIFVVIQWQSSLKREHKLREENLIFQNETLKNQVNPHFLFNSLNTLSSLVNSQPDIAEEFIQRLSSIYRYILENSSKNRVPLTSEIFFIKDYFFLHQIRDDGKIRMNVDVDENNNAEILPVSLQILIENAIKHNMSTRTNPLDINVYIEGNYVVVKNNLQKRATQLPSTKIGLDNLAQRAKLNTGKALVVEETASHFIVKVPLWL